jgi:hypothetical protein
VEGKNRRSNVGNGCGPLFFLRLTKYNILISGEGKKQCAAYRNDQPNHLLDLKEEVTRA